MSGSPDTSGRNKALPKSIAMFEPGSDDTVLSASRANEIIRACNGMIEFRGDKRIRVLHAAGNTRVFITQ